jgi:hypothetical protein
MYLVELRPGREELYRSVDELAAAIRSGDVDVHSRIFHRATSKWISITLHPQFKAIAAARESESLPPMPKKEWTFLTSAADGLEHDGGSSLVPEPGSPTDSSAGAAAESAAPTVGDASSGGSTGGWRRPVAFGITGLLLLLGVQVAFSVPRPRWPQFTASATPASASASMIDDVAEDVSAAELRESSVVSLASTAEWGHVGYPMPESDAGYASHAAPAGKLPTAPSVAPEANEGAVLPGQEQEEGGNDDEVSVETLIGRYDAAYEEARRALENGLRVAPLGQLAPVARLASPDGVGRLRLHLSGARNLTRAYYARAAEIERSQQDTFAVLSQQLAWPPKSVLRWYARPSHKESAAAAALTDAMLASIDDALGVLVRNAGAYDVTGESIAFAKPEAAAEYARLRRQVEQQLEAARAGASDGTTAVVLEAFGDLRLPVESSSR